MKKKICFICDSLHTLVAGSTFSTLRFIEILKKDYDIICIETDPIYKNGFNIVDGVKIYYINSILLPTTNGQLYLGITSKKKIRNILLNENISVIYTIIPTPLVLKSLIVANELKIKTISSSHCQIENIIGIKSSLIEKIFNYYLKYIYSKADVIVFPTYFAKNCLFNLLPLNKINNTYVISNGVNNDTYHPLKNIKKLKNKYKISLTKKILLYVGRLNPEKSVETLINSIPLINEHYQDFILLIVGDGVVSNNLKELTKKIQMENKIIFMGYILEKKLVEIYSIADIFIFPTIAELEGMVVLEAMACKNAIITSDSINNASKYFINKNGFLFEEKNSVDLADKTIKLLQDNSLLKKMKKQSYNISKKYSIYNSAKKIKKIIG